MRSFFPFVAYLSLFVVLSILAVIGAKANLSFIAISPSPFGTDNTPPAPAQYTEPPPPQTESETVVLKGNAESNSKLRVLVNDNKVAETSVDEASKFSVLVPLEEGRNEVTLLVTDNAGNTSEPSIMAKIFRAP